MKFKWRKRDTDLANAYREGWQAAYELHFHKPSGPVLPIAWLNSQTFQHMSPDNQKNDRWNKVADQL